MTWPEPEFAFRRFWICNQHRRIAGTTLSDIVRHLSRTFCRNGIDDFLDRIAEAGAEIVDAAGMAIGQHLDCKDMGRGKVAYMDEVANRRSIWRIVIDTEYRKL